MKEDKNTNENTNKKINENTNGNKTDKKAFAFSKPFIRSLIYIASGVLIFVICLLCFGLYEKNMDRITANKTFQNVYSVVPGNANPDNLPGTSSEYMIGFDYSDYELMSAVIEVKVRYDGKLETTFKYPLSNGQYREETKQFDLSEEQFKNIQSKVDLAKISNLDPKVSDPDKVSDGSDWWLFIYGSDNEVLKSVGGLTPHNDYFMETRRVLFDNLPEDFIKAYDNYNNECQFLNRIYANCRYGVFLSEKVDVSNYDILVIDSQEYTKDEISKLKKQNGFVVSYINIGSLENFRPYYSEYEDLTLGVYEHWEEEKWVNVTSPVWQDFILNTLAKEMDEKGIDGFFVDNCDVYYQYHNKKFLDGVSAIMQGLVAYGKPVIINGGDVFLDDYCEKKGEWSDVITCINQESVISKIEWDTDSLGQNNEEDFEYYSNYVEHYSELGAYVFLLEYSVDNNIMKKIEDYCREKDYAYYISDSVDLD